MFGLSGGRIDSIIGAGAEVRGPLSVDGSVVIDGRVDGGVTATERITLGAHAKVVGNLHAPVIIVGGKLHGSVFAEERAEVLASAHIDGDVRAPRLSIAEGATLSGKVAMATAEALAEPKKNNRRNP